MKKKLLLTTKTKNKNVVDEKKLLTTFGLMRLQPLEKKIVPVKAAHRSSLNLNDFSLCQGEWLKEIL